MSVESVRGFTHDSKLRTHNAALQASAPEAEQGSKRVHARLRPAKEIAGEFAVAHHLAKDLLEAHGIHSQSGQVLQAQVHVVVDLSAGNVCPQIGPSSRIGGK